MDGSNERLPIAGVRLHTMLAVILVLSALQGCDRSPASQNGSSGIGAPGVVENERYPAADVSGPHYSHSLVQAPLDALFYGAGAVVRAEVIEVAGPFWNQRDGQKWVDDPVGDYTVPVLYREVTLKISEAYRDDLGIVLGERTTILASGGGTNDELAIGYDTAFLGGTFTEGEEVVLLLSWEAFLMREGPIDALQPLLGGLSVLHKASRDGADVFVPERIGATSASAILKDVHSGISESEIAALVATVRSTGHPEWDWLRTPNTASDIEEMRKRDEQEVREREESGSSTTIEPGVAGE